MGKSGDLVSALSPPLSPPLAPPLAFLSWTPCPPCKDVALPGCRLARIPPAPYLGASATARSFDPVPFQVKIAQGLKAVPSAAWDACARSTEAGADPFNPFVSHAFLSSLEDSGCVGGRKGWVPPHLLLEDKDGALLGCAPCYLKSHSMGEYVFDHSWADAFQQAGGRYYPKLQAAIPFTPVSGPRLLVPEGPQAEGIRAHLIGGLDAIREQ